jgi:hypothetical protein
MHGTAQACDVPAPAPHCFTIGALVPFQCCRDEQKVRAALALISSHDGKPLRLELQ